MHIMEKSMYGYFSANERKHWWHIGKYAVVTQLLKKYTVGFPMLLEIGASFGTFARDCSKFAECYALDNHFDSIKIGNFKPSICGDAQKLPFKNESFDLVVALDVLEHVEDDQACLKEGMRVLRPGGKILFMVPAYPVLWSDLDEISYHYRRYTPGMLKKLFFSIPDIEIVKFSHFNFFLFFPILLIRVVQRIIKKIHKGISTESMSIPPKFVNYILTKMFLFEGKLVNVVDLPLGVSLIAIVEKKSQIAE
jgi:SAM-dependent methyltransferase